MNMVAHIIRLLESRQTRDRLGAMPGVFLRVDIARELGEEKYKATKPESRHATPKTDGCEYWTVEDDQGEGQDRSRRP